MRGSGLDQFTEAFHGVHPISWILVQLLFSSLQTLLVQCAYVLLVLRHDCFVGVSSSLATGKKEHGHKDTTILCFRYKNTPQEQHSLLTGSQIVCNVFFKVQSEFMSQVQLFFSHGQPLQSTIYESVRRECCFWRTKKVIRLINDWASALNVLLLLERY